MKRANLFLFLALLSLIALFVAAPPPELKADEKPQMLALQGETYKLPGGKEVELQGNTVAVKVNKDGSYDLNGITVDAKKTIIRDGKIEYVGSGTVKAGGITTDATDVKDVYLDGGKLKGTMNKASSKFAGIAAENSRFTYQMDGKLRMDLESTRLGEDGKTRPVVITSLALSYGGEISGVIQVDDKARKIQSPVIDGTIEQGLFKGQAQLYFTPYKVKSIDGMGFGQAGYNGPDQPDSLVALGFSGWKPLVEGAYVTFGKLDNPSIDGRATFPMPISFLQGNPYFPGIQERSIVLGVGYSDFSIAPNSLGDVDINVWPMEGNLFNLVNGPRILDQDDSGNIRSGSLPPRKTREEQPFPYAASMPLSVYYHTSIQGYWYRFDDGEVKVSPIGKAKSPDFSGINVKPRLHIK